MRAATQLWNGLSLYLRATLGSILALFIVFTAYIVVEVRSTQQQHLDARIRDTDAELAAMAQVFLSTPAVARQHSTDLMLASFIHAPAIEWIELLDGDRRHKAISAPALPAIAPAWFVRLLDIHPIERRVTFELPDGNTAEIAAREGISQQADTLWQIAVGKAQFGLISMLAILVTTLLVIRQTIRPLKKLTSSLAQFGAGDLSARGQVCGPREVAHSISAFNKMADQIESGLTALRESEAKNRRLAMIAEQTNEAVLTRDMDGKITFWNRGAEKLFGYTAEEAIGKTARELHMRNLSDRQFEALRSTIQAKQHWANEGERITKTGKLIYVAAKAAPMFDETGTMIGAIGIAQDITERREMELALRRAHGDLEVRVQERTRQLVEATAAAEQASRAKSEFLANMSHEVRTPMNGVLGMLALLLKSELPPRQKHFAQTAHGSGVALLKVLNDILDFSKIEAGKLEVETTQFSVRTITSDLAQLFGQRAYDKGLEIACQVERSVPEAVCSDPGRIRQVLANLIGNAVKFTTKGEIVVRVRVQESREHHVLLHFSVMDTGIGISPAAQARIFEPFEQADSTTTKKFGGTGLGLAVSKSLVGLMGGTMGVDSSPGQGSTFWFTVCASLGSTEATPRPAAQLDDLRVIAIEPNATLREILTYQLQDCGSVIDVLPSNADLITRLTRAADGSQPYHVAILAINRDDDLHWVRVIRACTALDSLRIVLLSSLAVDVPTALQRELRIDRILNKPVSEPQLRSALRTVAPTEDVAPAVTASSRFNAYVLAVDDYEVNQEIARDLLEELGCRVDVAVNGKEAVNAVANNQYDLVLMDCQMPEMDGFQATAAIRKSETPTGRRVPIIALTANAMRGDRDICIAAGMDDYLSKPFSPEQLYAVLAKWLTPTEVESTTTTSKETEAAVAPAQPPLPTSVPSPTPGIIDPAAIAKLRAIQRPGRPSSLHKWATAFLSSAHEHIQTMRTAVSSGDAPTLQRSAHTLKSGAAQFGAMDFSARCAALESLAKSGVIDGAMALIESLMNEFEPVRLALEAELQKAITV